MGEMILSFLNIFLKNVKRFCKDTREFFSQPAGRFLQIKKDDLKDRLWD